MGFSTRRLARQLDSLVRVSRRAGGNHLTRVDRSPLRFSCDSLPRLLQAGSSSRACPATSPHSDPQMRKGPRLPLRATQSAVEVPNRAVAGGLGANVAPQRFFPPLPSQRIQVFSPSFQSSFHLSFTVLVRYRSPINI
jgi:hypothetical protein